MGNLSNLYISQSFVSLIHLATNEAATATSTELQDGLGNGIGVYVNTSGALSASVFSGSVAGVGNVSAFSASVSSRINAISASGGIPAGTVSSSAQITALGFATTASVDALSTSVDSRLDALEFKDGTFVTTSSFASFTSSYFADSSSVDSRLDSLEFADGTFVTTASFNTFSTSVDSRLDAEEFKSTTFATTGSNTFVGNQIISGAVTASVAQISGLNYPTADNGVKSFIQTDGAGNLSLQYVDTIWESVSAGESVPKGTPLYISGAQGANPIVYAADASNPAKMPVTFIAGDAYTAGTTYPAIVLGLIEGIDLTGYNAGQTVYVAEGGGWSTSLPSGSSSITQVLGVVTKGGSGGKGLILNPGPAQLPTLQSGYIWVGNGSNRPVSQSVSTFGFATTGSNSFSGSQIVSGSLVVTGSVKGNISTITISSNTASIDFSLGSFFNLQLVSSSVPTFVTATNVKAGTTANLLVTQASTLSGSLRWDSNFKFPSGSSYTGSVSSSAKDIVSFVMYDDTTIYSVGAKNLI